MPSRKSDTTARRSDVSMAKFVHAEEGLANSAASAATHTAPIAPAPTASIEMDRERGSESLPPGDKREGRDSVTIEDLNLPKSIITRLAKGVLPPNTQIQANAILAMSKAATVFISHLAHAANERTKDSGKKTIMPADVFDALEDVEFPEFKDLIQAEFKKFNEIQTTKRNTYRRRVAAAKKGIPFVDPNASTQSISDPAPSSTAADTSTAAVDADTSTAAQRSAKKQKTNGPGDDSTMDLDGATEEYQDAETEPDDDNEDEDEDEPAEEEEEDEEEDEDEDGGDDEMHDALEERAQGDGEDEALDNGEDSDS